MKDLKFIKANADLPRGAITSTARRGDKWSKDAQVGDVVNLLVTESGANFGRAVVIRTEVKPLAKVCADCVVDNNHALKVGDADARKPDVLMADLKAAYGEDLKDEEPFTVVHLVVLNPEHVGV
jgi:hypothetical protein